MPKRDVSRRIGWVEDRLADLKNTKPGTSERRSAWIYLFDDVRGGLDEEWINLGHTEAKADARAKAKKPSRKGRK